MLHLAAPTEPSWAEWAVENLDELLIDHAHCEMKAASTALGLVFHYSQHDWMAAPLSAFAREELEHFEQVLALLKQRGVRFRGLPASRYAKRLRAFCRPDEPDKLIDTLLCCALIEARSCERFRLLAEHAPEAELRGFFESLLASEARHHHDFVAFADRLAPKDEVRARLALAAEHEARILAGPPTEVRLHDGGVGRPVPA